MRKICGLVLALVLALSCIPALAEETVDYATVFDFFRSLEGRISFTLPALPDAIREPDLMPRNGDETGVTSHLRWQNKTQLIGRSPSDGEYQVHIADLSPILEVYRQEHPQDPLVNLQYNALTNLALFYLNIHDGEFVGEPVPEEISGENGDFAALTFAYEYPDAEGVPYAGKGLMDGSRAVIVMGQQDEVLDRLLAEMRIVSPAEAEAIRARGSQTVSLGRMRITFPEPPESDETGFSIFYSAYTPAYAYLSAEHMPFDLSLMAGDMPLDDFLPFMAQATGEGYQSEGVLDSFTVEKIQPDVYRVDALGPESPYSLAGTRDRFHMYITPTGVYTVNSVDTDEGRAFLESIVFDAAE